MRYRVLIQPTAKAELREAYRWYNNETGWTDYGEAVEPARQRKR